MVVRDQFRTPEQCLREPLTQTWRGGCGWLGGSSCRFFCGGRWHFHRGCWRPHRRFCRVESGFACHPQGTDQAQYAARRQGDRQCEEERLGPEQGKRQDAHKRQHPGQRPPCNDDRSEPGATCGQHFLELLRKRRCGQGERRADGTRGHGAVRRPHHDDSGPRISAGVKLRRTRRAAKERVRDGLRSFRALSRRRKQCLLELPAICKRQFRKQVRRPTRIDRADRFEQFLFEQEERLLQPRLLFQDRKHGFIDGLEPDRARRGFAIWIGQRQRDLRLRRPVGIRADPS